MRKVVSLLVTAILCSLLVIAQSRTISGVVTDANGKPVPFATVTVKGTKNGVTADADGKYTLKNVPSGAVLVISSVGYDQREVTSGSSDNVSVTLTTTAGSNLTEVVVTSAFGIKKAQRTTPFSSQVVKSEQLNIIPQTSLTDALAGKIAGVQSRSQSNVKLGAGDQDFLRIRGGLSLGDLGPIFVVDGTIVNAFEINPDDVEDISVLKGANATALFGERAAGGAIVINTKKRGPKQGIGVELTQGVTIDKVYILPKYQNLYSGGGSSDLIQFQYIPGQHPAEWAALDGKYYPDYTDDASWGPRMTGQEYVPWYAWFPGHQYSFKTAPLVAQPDNARDFWETGITNTTNAAFSKNGPGYSVRMSYTNQYIKGLLPYTSSKRNNLFFASSVDLNEHFTVGVNATYSTTTVRGEFVDGYANQSSGSFNQWFHRHNDMKILKQLQGMLSPTGNLLSWNFYTNPDGATGYDDIDGNYWYNYYDYFKNRDVVNGRDRFFGDFSVQYKLNSHFNVKATVRKNQLTTYSQDIWTSLLEKSALQSGVLASYSTSNTYYDEYNYEGLANYSNTFLGKLAVSVTGGGNILRTLYKDNSASTVNGLNIPDLYSIANSAAQPSVGNTRQASRVNSLFATGDVEWNKFASVTFAVRDDWYSTLLKENGNDLFSPSLGAAFVFSEFTKSSLPWISFGKVYGSWGRKPRSLAIFQNNFGYSPASVLWDGNFLMGTPNSVVDSKLKGSTITTYEAGFDLRFLKGRLGLNAVYYTEDNDGEPLSVQVDPVSGFTSLVVNAVKIRRQGIDIQITASPVKSKNFSWDISKTFGYLINNQVVKIFGTQTRVLLSGGAFGTRFARAFQELRSDWGQLIGGGIKRNADGQMVVSPTSGLFIVDPDKHWGSVVPKTTGGLINTFTYKDFVLNFSLDYQIGGKFFSLSESWGYFSGLLEQTAATNDKGKNVRDAVADGGGVHIVGVSSVDEKTVVDTYVSAFSYFHQFYSRRIAEPFIHDLTFVKVREASIGYRIPVKKLGNISKYVQGATFSVIARNPWIIYRDAKNFDPSEISGVFGEDGQLPGTRSIGASLKLLF
ncbi:MAG: SusC/RagA family TonB-linked outer membrane protein [Chitinophagaceae bacterium]|nr:MAG: SusC/RagA family TonB-linked outer membrane protein [Chitinophagaceae bacterium]